MTNAQRHQRYIERLEAGTQYRIDLAERTPALDCDDLYAQLRIDRTAALAQLAGLNAAQLELQAICFAAMINELHGTWIDGAHFVSWWNEKIGLEQMRRAA